MAEHLVESSKPVSSYAHAIAGTKQFEAAGPLAVESNSVLLSFKRFDYWPRPRIAVEDSAGQKIHESRLS
jgi:hypothetical protein